MTDCSSLSVGERMRESYAAATAASVAAATSRSRARLASVRPLRPPEPSVRDPWIRVSDAAVLAADGRHKCGDLRVSGNTDERDGPLPAVLEHIWQTLRDVIRVVGEVADVRTRAREDEVDPKLVHQLRRSGSIKGRFAVAQW